MKTKLLLTLLLSTSAIAEIGDGIPEIDRSNFSEVYISYSINGELRQELFKVPSIIPDLAKVKEIAFSPIDPTRNFSRLPNYGLAKFHWWLFGFEVLPRAQRQYSACIGSINEVLQLLKLAPIDDPKSDLYPRIVAIREYVVPFEPIQNLYDKTSAPDLEAAIAHAEAAVFSVNLTVLETKLCEQALDFMREQRTTYINKLISDKVKEATSKKPIKRPNRR